MLVGCKERVAVEPEPEVDIVEPEPEVDVVNPELEVNIVNPEQEDQIEEYGKRYCFCKLRKIRFNIASKTKKIKLVNYYYQFLMYRFGLQRLYATY